jgi:hypothetical protein
MLGKSSGLVKLFKGEHPLKAVSFGELSPFQENTGLKPQGNLMQNAPSAAG